MKDLRKQWSGIHMTYWDKQAETSSPANIVTLNDYNQRELELHFISKYLNKTDFVIEAGCGNGYSTRTFSKLVDHVLAFDFSEAMIERAIRENKDLDNVVFTTGDVQDTKFDDNIADVVVSQRCLINLNTWEKQKSAINEIHRILKPGGLFVLVEGIEIDGLNKVRKKMGLSQINVVSHNNNFNAEKLVKHIKREFYIVEIRTFGMYDFITRILHPLVVYPNEPKYDAKINEIAKRIELELIDSGDMLSWYCMSEFSKFSRIEGIAAVKI